MNQDQLVQQHPNQYHQQSQKKQNASAKSFCQSWCYLIIPGSVEPPGPPPSTKVQLIYSDPGSADLVHTSLAPYVHDRPFPPPGSLASVLWLLYPILNLLHISLLLLDLCLPHPRAIQIYRAHPPVYQSTHLWFLSPLVPFFPTLMYPNPFASPQPVSETHLHLLRVAPGFCSWSPIHPVYMQPAPWFPWTRSYLSQFCLCPLPILP